MNFEETRPRIKRWCRVRNIILAIMGLFLISFGWVLIEVLSVAKGKPNVSRNYREEFRQRSALVAGLPADYTGAESWSFLAETLDMTTSIVDAGREDSFADEFKQRYDADVGIVDFDYVRSGRSMPSDIDRELRVISRLRESGVLARLDRLEAMPMGFRPTDSTSPLIQDKLPEFKKARNLAKAMAALMRVEAAAGNHDRVVQIFGQMLLLARTISHQPLIISCLVGVAIEAIAIGELQHILQEADFSAAQCRLAIDLMNSRRLPTFELVAESERIVLHDFAQHYFSDDGHGDGYVLPSVADGDMASPTHIAAIDNFLARFTFATRAQTVQTYDYYLDNAIAESRKPRKERWKSFDAREFAENLTWRYRLVQLLIPALTEMIDGQDYLALKRRATIVMLALEAYRAVHGRFPETLESLVPEFLTELPVDPYNGKILGYKLIKDNVHGRDYLLYSFGADGQDNNAIDTSAKDGGPIKIDPTKALSDVRLAGSDYIINTPRDKEPE